MEDCNLQRLDVFNPPDRRKVERGAAKQGGISLFVESTHMPMFERERIEEDVKWDRTLRCVLGRPQAADRVRESRAHIDIVDRSLKLPAGPGSGEEERLHRASSLVDARVEK